MPLFNINNKVLIDGYDQVQDYLLNKIVSGTGTTISTTNYIVPLAQYLINEASSGQSPTALIDNTANPLNLTLSYTGANPSFTSTSAGNALIWSATTTTNNAMATSGFTLSGTKFDTALSASKKITIEIVITISVTNLAGIYFQIGDLFETGGRISLHPDNGTVGKIVYGPNYGAGSESNTVILPTGVRSVYHLVVDSTQSVPRTYEIYKNGYFLGGPQFPLDQNDLIGSVAASGITIGNNSGGNSGSLGDGAAVHYLAIYADAMSEAQIQRNAASLLLNDDEDPNSNFADEILNINNPLALSAGTQYYFNDRLFFINNNNISFGINSANSVLTAAIPGIPQYIVSNGAASTGTVIFAGSNSVTFGMSGSTRITASIPSGATATGNINGFSIGTALLTGNLSFGNSNNVALGMSGSTRITGSITAGTIPSAYSASGSSASSGTIALSNGNGIFFGMNGNTVTASAGSDAYSSVTAISAGTASVNSGTLMFSNSGNITFGINANTVTASMQSGQTLPINAISAGTTSISSNSLVLSNANGIQFGINGSTVTASYGPVLSQFEYPPGQFASNSAGAYSHGTQGFVPFYAPLNVSATMAQMLFSISAAATTGQGTLSMNMGVYTNNAGTLSLATAGVQSYTWSVTATSIYNGVRMITVPITMSMTPGQYWFGYLIRTTGNSSASISLTHYGGLGQTNWSGPWGAVTNSTQRLEDGLGYYTVSQTALLSSAVISNINHMSNIRMPWFVFKATS